MAAESPQVVKENTSSTSTNEGVPRSGLERVAYTPEKHTETNSQEEICGWLSKRARFSHKWRRQWFLVDRNTLRYGNSEKDIPKKIALEGARILESNKDSRLHTFSVQPRSGKRVYYLQADDELGRNKWMQAICFAKMANGTEDKKSLCAIL